MKRKIVIGTLIFLFVFIIFGCQNDKPDFKQGKGVYGDPFVIETYEDLFKMSSETSYYYVLRSDIYNTEDLIINSSLGDFYGHFNGNGYTIHNVIIQNLDGYTDNVSEIKIAGLFSTLKTNATIEYLLLENTQIDFDYNGFGYVGSLVGLMEENSKLSEIVVEGTMNITLSDGLIGGVVGSAYDLTYVLSEVAIEATSNNFAFSIGGIAGDNKGVITKSISQGEIALTIGNSVEFDNNYNLVGGISGEAFASITYSVSDTFITIVADERNIRMRMSAGEITGRLSSTIQYCMTLGSIDITSNADIFAGGMAGFILSNYTLKNSVALSTITYRGDNLDDVYIGGAVGYTPSVTNVTMIYYSEEIGFNKAVGNFNDNLLTNIESHTLNFYLSGIELDYLNDKFYCQEGNLPKIFDSRVNGVFTSDYFSSYESV